MTKKCRVFNAVDAIGSITSPVHFTSLFATSWALYQTGGVINSLTRFRTTHIHISSS